MEFSGTASGERNWTSRISSNIPIGGFILVIGLQINSLFRRLLGESLEISLEGGQLVERKYGARARLKHYDDIEFDLSLFLHSRQDAKV
jgi:hypothetical protein